MNRSPINSIIDHGLRNSIVIAKNLLVRKILWKLLNKHFATISGVRREMLGKELLEKSGRVVMNGYFQGMKLGKLTWGARDAGPMLLGTYEQQVQSKIICSPDRYKVFVDIGAADGFYAIGLILNGRFKKAICFESKSKSRTAILENAKENNVDSHLLILGEAEKYFHKHLTVDLELKPEELIFLIDIEGGEFEILNSEIFEALQASMFVIEIHRTVDDFHAKYINLVENASKFFYVETIHSNINQNTFNPIMENWADEDRQIVLSEGRRYQMHWLVLTPKNLPK